LYVSRIDVWNFRKQRRQYWKLRRNWLPRIWLRVHGEISAAGWEVIIFLITPSGRSYEQLTGNQLVLVSLEGLAYTGSLKPSSEKGIHALVYKTHPKVNCVIHTPQEMASLMSLIGNNIAISDDWRELLGETIPTSQYGLPGTKALMKQVGRVLKDYATPAVLMANHGALCFGSSPQAFPTSFFPRGGGANNHLGKER
jgi:L-fuculose-phosphate aldolase